jgi:hypothetical protein
MSQNTLISTSGTVTGDTAATGNTAVMRSPTGGINANIIQGTELSTTGIYSGQPSIQTANFVAGAATDYFVNCTAGAVLCTLPAAASNVDVIYNFIKTDSSGNQLTIATAVGKTVTTAQYDGMRASNDGTTWYGK